ncbi:hypothetical protein V493_03088 [Pseudogymnoascus sp. VKM F-4281 (FW-2241)]|nr:hypothetical protein V493_03088 [Pseudogymnoascus sp. VKM F-4281 (FW-2241)]
MADPLTVIGIIANIIQLVDFSATVLGRLNEFRSDLGEIPKSFRPISDVLPVVLEALNETKDKIENGAIKDSTKAALLPAVQGCSDQIQALDNLLVKILPVKGESLRKKSTKAIWSLKYETEVEGITKTLHRYITTFTFYHVASSSTLQPMNDTTLVGIRRWLSAPDPSTNYQKAVKLHQPNTGLWLLESEIYSKWKSNGPSFVWLHGIPGCGKTILSSTVTHDILLYCDEDPGKVVAYFYFDFTNEDKQKPELMVRSLISQLSEKCIKMPLALKELYVSLDEGNRQPSLDALMDVLQHMLQEFPQSYLILDALDECADRDELMEILEQIAGWQVEETRILLTSRKERDIESSLDKIVNREYIICLQEKVVDEDIRIYVHQRLSDDKKLQKWQDDAEIRQKIETALVEGSRGMFRWAVCQMDSLGKCRTRRALEKALKELPATLDETYERILCTISEEDSEYAIRILQWLAFSFKPLLIEQLAEVVAINIERETAFDRNEVLEDPMDVLDICMSLVTVAEGIVTLAHYSVQEYLVSSRICQGGAAQYSIRSAACHGYIAKASIGYLLQYEKGFFDRFDSAESLLEEYTLALYSAEHWMRHTREAEEDDNQLSYLAMKFMSTGEGAYLNWLRLYDVDEPWNKPNFRRELGWCPNPLYYASLSGIANIAILLVEQGADVNAQAGRFGNALPAASYKGHEKIVEMLISNGADVNLDNAQLEHGTALRAASSQGHEKIVEMLISNSADVNAQHEHGTALYAASEAGHDKIVEVLLSKGANVNAQVGRFGNALRAASDRGHDKIIEILLSKGSDVNAQGYYGTALWAASSQGYKNTIEILISNGADVNAQIERGTALYAASEAGHDKIVEVLLSKGANVNAQVGLLGNALQVASTRGHDKIIEILLSKGADVDAQGYYGTALQAASYKGHEKIVELLLSRGADINAQGGKRGNALQAASYEGHENIVELLLSKGANINAQGGKHGNALQAAAAPYTGHDKIIEILLSKGADVNAQGGKYGNALLAASFRGHEKIVELLVSNGADVNAQGGKYCNALQAALWEGHCVIVGMLINNGADVNAQGWYGNALHSVAALYKAHDKIVEVLLSSGADVNAQGGEYGNALQAASFRGHDKIVEMLISNGANVNTQGGRHGTALQAAVAVYEAHDKIVEMLISNGADVNAQGKNGTALQVASKRGHKKIVEMLLSKGAIQDAERLEIR